MYVVVVTALLEGEALVRGLDPIDWFVGNEHNCTRLLATVRIF